MAVLGGLVATACDTSLRLVSPAEADSATQASRSDKLATSLQRSAYLCAE